jgi:hypothetical protein
MNYKETLERLLHDITFLVLEESHGNLEIDTCLAGKVLFSGEYETNFLDTIISFKDTAALPIIRIQTYKNTEALHHQNLYEAFLRYLLFAEANGGNLDGKIIKVMPIEALIKNGHIK